MESNTGEIDNIEIKMDKYITKIAEQEGYNNYIVEKRNLSKKGESFIGIVYEVNIKGKTKNGDKETNLFIKNIINIDKMIFSLESVFGTEVFFYMELRNIFDELQNEVKIPKDEQLKIPQAYEQTNVEAIILENLTKRGFRTYNRMDITNIDYAVKVMKNLAKFHALSFVIQHRRPDYENKIKTIKVPFQFNNYWKGFVDNMVEKSLKCLNENILEKYETKIREKVECYQIYLTDEKCVRVLCHGDYRPNNIMVKENNGKVEDVIAIDYQIINYGNPVLDIIYFIMWSTDQEFRRKYMNVLKDTYYDHMQEYLKYFNLNLNDIYPRSEFEMQFKTKLDFGVFIALIYLPFLFHFEEDTPDLSRLDNNAETANIKFDPKFQDRLNGIFDDLGNWGFFN